MFAGDAVALPALGSPFFFVADEALVFEGPQALFVPCREHKHACLSGWQRSELALYLVLGTAAKNATAKKVRAKKCVY